MAKDFLLKHICPHFVVGEWLTLGTDLRTLTPVKNPSSNLVGIKSNGVTIPKEGLTRGVRLSSTLSGPFVLRGGASDFLRVQVNGGAFQKIQLPQGDRVSTQNIVSLINSSVAGVSAQVSREGIMEVWTDTKGTNTSLYFVGSEGHVALGLPEHRYYRGSLVYPSWNVVQTNPVNPLEKVVRFQEPLKSVETIWEMSYFTRRQDCRRCSGLGIEHDLRHDLRGDPKFITGIDLLAQEVDKISFTIRGSNLFYQWYGTSIVELVGTKIIRGGGFLESQLVSEIGSALERFRSVKKQQASLQPVGDQEYFSRVRNIAVIQDPNDNTSFNIQIDIENRAQEVATLRQSLLLNDPSTGSRFVG
jgi:hypothetical protein